MYPSLPAGAQQVTVRNVYDGDTLTLTDERRVRLLGVDTPEVKENQPFAQEAKDYTKTAILGDGNQRNGQKGNDVWISFEPGQESEDKYGRLLAYVWVRSSGEDNEKENGNGNGGGFANAFNRFGDGDDDDEEQQMNSGYLCVNEGIIAAGYASAYTPNANSKTRNWDKLVSLQMQARESKRGMWSADTGTTAASNSTKYYKTANGSAYHHKNCEHLSNIRNLTVERVFNKRQAKKLRVLVPIAIHVSCCHVWEEGQGVYTVALAVFKEGPAL
jgi:endonuclease YncB( thermonuclease family)